MKIILAILSLCIVAGAVVFYIFFAPVTVKNEPVLFTVPQTTVGYDPVTPLTEQNLIKNPQGFRFLYLWFSGGANVKPGGYRVNKNMNAWQTMKKVTGKPDLLWVTIAGCQRKEQIGEKLAGVLGWGKEEIDQWDSTYTVANSDYAEGVYYPDTYLIPVDEKPPAVAKRFIDHFNEKFAPLTDLYIAKDIKWTTGLKIASLIGRESGGPDDMSLISGIIWNRLNRGMPLEIDATMQYTEGKRPDGTWWGTVDLAQKQNDSPYNSYLHKGLPPTPICSPSIDEIAAALNPAETDCLYYLHDHNKQIHCAVTYAEHKANIKKYLDTSP